MSGLAGVLAGRRPAGVYRWDSHARTADIAHAVEHAGWGFVYLDTVRAEDGMAFLQEAHTTFGLPDSFGYTFGALGEALADLRHEQGTVILWEGWSPFARGSRAQFKAAVDVLGRRCDSTEGGAFVVLLRGDGPALGLPQLDPHGHVRH